VPFEAGQEMQANFQTLRMKVCF